ncbi:phosphotransferase [Trueperella sp. LYQ141]|uniref:phosphotransferase n=1 Tax=Trueperella sp. LYQ141 TaxID=3391058 RepID=UPI0039839C50
MTTNSDSIFPQFSLTELTAIVRPWMTRMRWYTGQPDDDITLTHALRLGQESDQCTSAMFLIRAPHALFNVPLTFRRLTDRSGSLTSLTAEPIGIMRGDIGVFDATDDPHGQYALLGSVLRTEYQATSEAPATHIPFAPTGTLAAPPEHCTASDGAIGTTEGYLPAMTLQSTVFHNDQTPIVSSTRLRSEQSNTSIIFRFASPESAPKSACAGIIMKVFRVLSSGMNPDVELQSALDRSQCGCVVRQFGAAVAHWDNKSTHALFAQEFLDGAVDAWQIFTNHPDTGMDENTRENIRTLGLMTRAMHEALAREFPTRPIGPTDRDAIRATWDTRATQALTDAPELAQYRAAITAIFDAAMDSPWPAVQRIHGDYHLGQVIYSAQRQQWYALDFEGEPLRPLAERVAPDLALRDVAGMLRSFDYASGTRQRAGASGEASEQWCAQAQQSFLDGYGDIPSTYRPLLRALVLDKALYEVSYEYASRPDWIDIPVRGILKIIGQEKQ